jgi:transposase
MAKARRTFSREFKVAAVRMVTERGSSVAEAAERLGIRENLLRKWKQSLEGDGSQAFPGKGKLSAVDEELRQRRAENKRLKMTKDILRKATVYFAKESQ